MATRSYAKAFVDGHVLCSAPNREARLSIEKIADLSVPSGEIVVCDAQSEPSKTSPRVTVAPGSYAVWISRRVSLRQGRRVAFARVDLSSETPAKWTKLGTASVDCGYASFRDRASVPVEEAYGDFFSAGDGRLVGVESGWGDGRYGCFLGRDAKGSPAALLLDFEVAFEESWNVTELALPRAPGRIDCVDLDEHGVKLALVDRWKSRPIDRTREVALEMRSPDSAADVAVELEGAACERDEVVDHGLRLVHWSSAEKLAPGASLRIYTLHRRVAVR